MSTLSTDQLLHAYRVMRTIRAFEERLHVEFATGEIPGFVHLYAGEEASAAGVMAHLRDDDCIASTHRGHGHCIAKGVDVHGMMAEIYGKKTGVCQGKGGSMHPAEPGGRLRLGSMESTAASRLPALLASYHKACPRVALEVSTGTSRALFDGVRARRLDCALVAAGPGWAGELDGSGLRGEPLFREELLMILPAEHPPVHDVAEVRLRTLAGFARGCTYRQLAEDSLGTPLTAQEVGSYHAILACVAAGACVGVLPRSVLQLLGTPPLRSLPLAEVDTWLVWREGYATAAFERWRGVLGQAGD
ncbi:TPA: hypothetical protein L5B43_004386 [Pseudomonas aeruginosa]|nr:hypothetical protein [Pseudomonas aeruginosa]